MSGTIKRQFTGSIPEHYDRYMGPAWFGPFGRDLAARLAPDPGGDVLELACGTGLVTRALRQRLAPSRRLVATDLSAPMLAYARAELADLEGIEWREADASKLPFPDASFAAVVCSFGVMFVPAREALFAEARRVLRPGGTFLFNVWDHVEENPCALANAQVVQALFPNDAEVLFDTPYSMADESLLRRLLRDARFDDVRIEKKRLPVEGVTARSIALGPVRGSPRGALMEKRGVPMDEFIEKVAAALSRVGGDPFRSHAQAIVAEARAA